MQSLRLVVLLLTLIACLQAQNKPASSRPAAPPAGERADAKIEVIDVNSATEEQLRTVPGIGEAYSKKIIAGRPYRAKNELVQKKILPEGVYNKAKDHLIAKQK